MSIYATHWRSNTQLPTHNVNSICKKFGGERVIDTPKTNNANESAMLKGNTGYFLGVQLWDFAEGKG